MSCGTVARQAGRGLSRVINSWQERIKKATICESQCGYSLKEDKAIEVVSLPPYSRLLRFCHVKPTAEKAWAPVAWVDCGGTSLAALLEKTTIASSLQGRQFISGYSKMIEQDSLCYINSPSSELTVNSDDRMIIQSPDLVSFSLVATSIDNKHIRQAMTVNNLQRQRYSKDLFRNSELPIRSCSYDRA